MLDKKLNAQIIKFRSRMKLKPAEVAEVMGMTAEDYDLVENGKDSPSKEALNKMLNHYSLSSNWFNDFSVIEEPMHDRIFKVIQDDRFNKIASKFK
jgi:transcriptional regulator with XRE-family HTH domain